MDDKPSADLDEIARLIKHEEKDALLIRLVDLANTGVCAPITISVGGTLITGMLISGEKYYESFGGLIANGLEEELASVIRQEFSEYATDYRDTPIDLANRPYRYIHLADANVVVQNGLLPAGGNFLWRGKISSVDGFWFGMLSNLRIN